MRLSRRSLRGRVALASALTVAATAVAALGLLAGPAAAAPASSSAARAEIQLIGVKDVSELLKGIPQSGPWLGSATAPLQMVVFADLQCPYCKQYDVEINPTIIRKYVRTGKIRLYFSGMDFVGEDSNRGLKAAAAAANQNKLWHLVQLLYINQGQENKGWLSDKMVAAVAKATPGLDVKKFDSDRKGKAIDARMKNWQALASSAGVNSTPTFFVGTPGKLAPLQVSRLQVAQFTTALDKLVKAT